MNYQSVVESVLAEMQDPNCLRPLSTVADIASVKVNDSFLEVSLMMPYPVGSFGRGLATLVEAQLGGQLDGLQPRVTVGWHVQPQAAKGGIPTMQEVKNIIAVASGKGGVGKSTTAVNLALALKKEGANVGLLDADVYGPSQAMMLGVPPSTRPDTEDDKYMLPVLAHGIQSMSMAYLVDEQTPMVWRGPMVSSALQQMLMQTKWQQLDYLIVDMPPGTGDIQLTLSQKVPATGAVIVTTPQDIALLDAKKGIEMFRKVNIPVLGIVENMAVHVCSNCGHEEHVFGELGGARLADQYDTRLLASMPLDMAIRQQADGGEPTVISEPDSEVTIRYQHAALALASEVAMLTKSAPNIPSIQISDD
ncbi:iron-sulfur cluster carrier protein ApbC [Gynuella sunshinyii]|uniref:Iron-sulfur cluster carrier protein n=1 Tax=Gynuella sunshinyii YC6258 TaxID=1445510 RepID=A0A0C5VME9_9GAMM|nr:iron-sulfur cluster carrier protein ApbC [Gynuella sunshinyii]AJQ95902.1 ATPase involved in chromosome partitioning [Gynuella sunshinyii YC6258]